MQVNNDSKDNLMLNQEIIICFTMVLLSCQTVNFEFSGRKKHFFVNCFAQSGQIFLLASNEYVGS